MSKQKITPISTAASRGFGPSGEACLHPCPLGALCECGTEGGGGDKGRFPVAQHTVARGQTLFESGEPFVGLYVLRSGAFKNVAQLPGQEEQVVDFRMPGDILGMAAMAEQRHPFSAKALENSQVCCLSLESVRGMELHQDLFCAMSVHMRRVQWASVLLRTQNAEQRIIHFLLDIARATQASAEGEVDMRLPMSRKDIANYLGIAVETVSRGLHRLQSDKLLHTSGRNMKLLDTAGLASRLDGTEPVVYS